MNKLIYALLIMMAAVAAWPEQRSGYLWERIETGPYDDENIPAGDSAWMTVHQEIPREGKAPVSITYSGPDSVLLGFDDGQLWNWDLNARRKIWSRQIIPDAPNADEVISAPAISRGFTRAAVLTGLTIKIIDLSTGNILKEIGNLSTPDANCAEFKLGAADAAFEDDGSLVTRFSITAQANRPPCKIVDKNYLIKWNLQTGKQAWIYQLKIPECNNDEPNWCMAPAPAFSLSPRGNLLAGASCDGSIFFLDTATGKERSRRPCPAAEDSEIYGKYPSLGGSPMAFLWTRDGKDLLAAFSPASSAEVNVVRYAGADQPPGKQGQFLVDMNGSAPAMKLNPGGSLLFINTGDFRVFDLKSGKQAYLSLAFAGFDVNPRKQEIATLSAQGFFLRHVKRPARIRAGEWRPTGLYFNNHQDLLVRASGEITIGFGQNRYTGDRRNNVLYLNALRGEGAAGDKSGELILNLEPAGEATVYGGRSRAESESLAAMRNSLPGW